MPAACAERSYLGVEQQSGPANGYFPCLQKGVTSSANGLELCSSRQDSCAFPGEVFLFVEGGPQDRDDKMRKIRSPFIQLQPTHHAMLRQILRNARIRNSQVLRELRIDPLHSTTARSAAH